MDGVLNIYKPVGITSFDAVRIVKKISNTKKVGHAGTLDPEATGVLPVCLGKGTKIIEYIMDNTKVYEVQLKLGITTDTYDREGEILSEKEVLSNDDEIANAVMSFKGEIFQVPPMYSALKVNGKKLYDLARSGIEIERNPRKINIFDIRIHSIQRPFVNFEVTCSKGTYIRSLCFDIGEKLGCGGMMNKLERIAAGRFNIEKSININELNKDNIDKYLITIDNALIEYEMITVEDKFERLLRNGVNIKDPRLTQVIGDDRLKRVYNKRNELIGIGARSKDEFKIFKLLI